MRSTPCTLIAGLAVGVPLTVWQVRVSFGSDPEAGEWLPILTAFAGLPMALAYASAVGLLIKTRGVGLLRALFESVGKMSLTTYVGASVCWKLVSLLLPPESIPMTTLVGLIAVFFAGQVLLSHLWLRRFRMGPLEWVWRSVTHWSVATPIRRRRQGDEQIATGPSSPLESRPLA